jgi:myosin heavy chain 6/7
MRSSLNVTPCPDATPFLFVSFEMKKEDSLKVYDAKKSVWVPNKEDGGYDEALIQEVNGDKAIVKVGWESKEFLASELQQINPPKMEKAEDMSNMTYLNDASVLWNLKSRYQAKMIYVSCAHLKNRYICGNNALLQTYSGLFCVVINPYVRYPIYTNTVVKMYIGKRRNEVPPHLFAISDGAYQQMMNGDASKYSRSSHS